MTRRLPLLLAPVCLAASLAAADDLQTLGRDFWTWRAAMQPVNRDDIPRLVRPAGWTPQWTPESVAARREKLAALEERWRRLADPAKADVAWQVDYRLVGSALARVKWELDVTRAWKRDPGFYVDQTLAALVEDLLQPPPFDRERSAAVVGLIASFPGTLDAARANLTEPAAPFAKLAIGDLTGIGPRLTAASRALKPLLEASAAARLDAATEKAVSALDGYRGWLEARLPSMGNETAVGRDGYLFFLRHVALIPYTPEELLAMGRQERDRAVAFEAYQRQRDEGLPELPLAPDQAAQVARAAKDEAAIRRFLEEKGVCTVPAWIKPYGYRPVPAYLDALAGLGEWTDFTSPLRLKESTGRYIPVPSEKLGYFSRSMAKDPRSDMVHEGIPGHAFQIVLSFTHEDELRRHYYDSGANEGIGFYVEEMLLQMGLVDDSPKTREDLYSYLRLRALRVEVDVQLALGTFTIDQAAEYLRVNVPMDAATAKAEAASFASIPGQAISYQIGKLQIVKLLAEARRKQGDRFSLRRFHDSLLMNGNVPLSLQRWEMLGLRDEVDALGK